MSQQELEDAEWRNNFARPTGVLSLLGVPGFAALMFLISACRAPVHFRSATPARIRRHSAS